MKHRNWFWGIFFLAAAVFVIVCQTTKFVVVGFWSIAATVLLAAVLISSLVYLNFFGIFISAALLYLIYQAPFGWPVIIPWLLILAAVLASIGFSMIFHGRHHHWEHFDWHEHCSSMDSCCKTGENIDGNDVYVKTSFSESCKYLHADCLKYAHLDSSFGKLSIYFDQVQLSPDGAQAFINASFGEMVLYIPGSWRVIDNLHAGFGAVDNDMRNNTIDANAPTLTLTGNVSFGNLEIRYV